MPFNRITPFLFAISISSTSVLAQHSHTLSSLPFSVVQGTFQMQISSDSTFAFDCRIANSSQTNDTLYFKRTQQLPSGWNTSVCLTPGECYSTQTDSVMFILSPSGTFNASIGLSLNVDPCLNNVPDSTTVWVRVGSIGSPSDTILIPFSVSFIPPNPALVFQWSGMAGGDPSFDTTFIGTGEHSIANFLQNAYGHGANYNFTIHDSMPQDWTLKTCVLSDYSDSCSTGNNFTVNFSGINDSTSQQLVRLTLNVPELTAIDTASIYLTVHPLISNPADSATYRYSIVVQPLSSVSELPSISSRLTASPNPFQGTTQIIYAAAQDEKDITFAAYDLLGRVLMSLPAHTNGLNYSTSFDGSALPDGTYVILVHSSKGTSEVRVVNEQ